MGEYYTNVQIDFEGTTQEKDKFKKLLVLMDKEEIFDEDDFDESPYEIDDIIENALLGKLKDRGEDSDYVVRYFPDFDLTLAPKLFAALFPQASFSYDAEWEYSAGGGITAFHAEYNDGKLIAKQCQTEDDLEELDEEIQEQYEDGDLESIELIEMLMEIKKPKKLKPSINAKYVKSFFDEGDISEYLDMAD